MTTRTFQRRSLTTDRGSSGMRFLSLFLASALVIPGGLAAPEAAEALGTTTRASVSSAGVEANGSSENFAISANGRFVVFDSIATNLVAGDTNGTRDVFIRDRQTGTTERVSVSSTGVQANGSSMKPTISADGRYVAFESLATNLVSPTGNGYLHIYRRDRTTRLTVRVSVIGASTQGNANSYNPSISGNGRYVAFDSTATNLVSGDSNQARDVFVRDVDTSTTTRVSLTSTGTQATFQKPSQKPSISADGRYVAFESDATNLVSGTDNGKWHVYVRDRTGATTIRVSVTSGGTQGDNWSQNAAISGDGRYVAFDSYATNLVTGDTNGVLDVFVRDLTTSQTTRISRSSSGAQGNAASSGPSISFDGRYVAFPSGATNLVDGDTNGQTDIFVRDRTDSQTLRVSVSSGGEQADSYSFPSAISADGLTVAFRSYASNLISGDDNNAADIFVNERPLPLPLATVTNLTSTTHPSSTTWYSSTTPSFQWTGSGSATGYSYSMSQNSADVPDNTQDTPDQSYMSGPMADGVWYFKVKARNADDVWGPVAGPVTVRIDATAPVGTISIDSGATHTSSPDVTVSHTVTWGPSGAGQMRHSLDGGVNWTAWETYAATKALTLSAGDGTKTVRAEFRDNASPQNTSTAVISDDIILDTTLPSVTGLGSSTHPDPSTWYSSNTPAFQWTGVNGSSGISGYSYSISQNSADVPDNTQDTTSQSYTSEPRADGVWYFKVKARNTAGLWGSVAGPVTVRIDATAPVGTISINSGATHTNSTSVTVSHAVTWGPSGAGQMRHSLDGGATWTAWETYAATKALTLPAGDGTKTVRAQFRDNASPQNVSTALISDSIILDTQAPLPTVIAGSNRYATAIAGSKAAFPSAPAVVIATGENFADALGGAGLAGALKSPLLLTEKAALPGAVATEIGRLKASKAYILGGTGAVSANVEVALKRQLGAANVVRIAGSNRYDTANRVAARTISILGTGYSGDAFIATGANYPDALGASPIAAAEGMPVILADPASASVTLPASVKRVWITGGTSAVPARVESSLLSRLGPGNVKRLAGDDRFDTAAKVATYGISRGMSWSGVGITTGMDFPDALAAGPVLGSRSYVMLLTDSNSVPAPTVNTLSANKTKIDAVHFFGGDAAVPPSVRTTVTNLVK